MGPLIFIFFCFLFFVFCLCFWRGCLWKALAVLKLLLYILAWPWAHRDSPASVSWVLGMGQDLWFCVCVLVWVYVCHMHRYPQGSEESAIETQRQVFFLGSDRIALNAGVTCSAPIPTFKHTLNERKHIDHLSQKAESLHRLIRPLVTFLPSWCHPSSHEKLPNISLQRGSLKITIL